MKNKKELGFFEAYKQDPIKADLDIFGRKTDESRRGFLKKSSLLAFAALVGANIPFAANYPSGLIPAALAAVDENFKIEGKNGLLYHNDKPITAETLPQFFDSEFVKPEHFFVRNNGLAPEIKDLDPKNWKLVIDGESCLKPTTFTLEELKKKFKHYTYALTVECGGNGRGEIIPATSGTQWGVGAIACGRWTGVRVKDVLESCGIKNDAVYVGYEGIDIPLDGDASKKPISRGIPIKKALEEETLIAWAYEGADIPFMNGYPLRLVAGGFPGSVSGKWLTKLSVRNIVHDGPKMSESYKVPVNPVAPGTKVSKDTEMKIIESMPVKSVISHPVTNFKMDLDKTLEVRGKAWAGDLEVKEMEISIDFGETWQKATVEKPLNRLAWQSWKASVKFPQKGYYEVWARATDTNGKKQPMVLPAWNPKGYLNNSCHRVAVYVG
ncbi:sulfite oxidase [Campylobacter sp. MOP7]|uniref:sulfite oxidase n=1 Tax=Campylobacter canis TaxID=3378588 RepID=UPI00387EC6FA